MLLEKNKYYLLKINHFGRNLSYKGKILKVGNKEFRISTEDNPDCRALTLRIKDITNLKEIPKPKRERKIFAIRKKPAKNLKSSVEPDF